MTISRDPHEEQMLAAAERMNEKADAAAAKAKNVIEKYRQGDAPIFSLRAEDGHWFHVYANGKTEGFPPGLVVNYISTVLSCLGANISLIAEAKQA